MDAFPSTRDEYAFVLWCQFASAAMAGLMARETKDAGRVAEMAEHAGYAADELLEQAEWRWPDEPDEADAKPPAG